MENQLYYEEKKIEEKTEMPFLSYAEKKGLQEGIQKGMQKGREEGKIEVLRKAIETVLEVKFGEVDESISNSLLKIHSVEKLEELLHQTKLTKSLNDFMASLKINEK